MTVVLNIDEMRRKGNVLVTGWGAVFGVLRGVVTFAGIQQRRLGASAKPRKQNSRTGEIHDERASGRHSTFAGTLRWSSDWELCEPWWRRTRGRGSRSWPHSQRGEAPGRPCSRL